MSKANIRLAHPVSTESDNKPSKELPESKVFCAFIVGIFAKMELEHADYLMKARIQLLDKLMVDNMPKDNREAFRRYLLNKEPLVLHEKISEPRMIEILQFFYEYLCELLGPIAADECMGYGLDQARGIPESGRFSPQRLL